MVDTVKLDGYAVDQKLVVFTNGDRAQTRFKMNDLTVAFQANGVEMGLFGIP